MKNPEKPPKSKEYKNYILFGFHDPHKRSQLKFQRTSHRSKYILQKQIINKNKINKQTNKTTKIN